MVLVSLDEKEIIEIKKTLENILIKDIPRKKQFIYLLLKWFKTKGVSFESSQKILCPYTQISNDSDDKKIAVNTLCSIQDDDYLIDSNIIEQQITDLLIETEGKENIFRIFSVLKSILPQKKISNTQFISSCLDGSMYGILSYDGPVVAICDNHNKQIIKGYFVRREDFKGREYHLIRFGEVIVEACPINMTVFNDDSKIEKEFQIKWVSYGGSSFIIGPCTLTEMILILKQKSLVLNSSILESALISICKTFVEEGKADCQNKLQEFGYQMTLGKWLEK